MIQMMTYVVDLQSSTNPTNCKMSNSGRFLIGAFFEARRNATAPKKTVPNDSCAFLPDILPLSNFLLPK